MNSQREAIRDARALGIPKMLLLGLQHMFAMFGATILVPILVNGYFEGEGLSVQVTLMCAGVGTLFFHLCTRLKVPAFLGSSFAFLGGFEAVARLDTGIFAGMTMGEKLPYACGGVVVAGALYLVLALLIKAIGVRKVMRFLPPVVTGPIIICIGLSLAPTAISLSLIHIWNISNKIRKVQFRLLAYSFNFYLSAVCGAIQHGGVPHINWVALSMVIKNFVQLYVVSNKETKLLQKATEDIIRNNLALEKEVLSTGENISSHLYLWDYMDEYDREKAESSSLIDFFEEAN